MAPVENQTLDVSKNKGRFVYLSVSGNCNDKLYLMIRF